MPASLPEYADWLDGRDELIWPGPPQERPVRAIPSIKPLPGIRAVTWSVYGTLLRIADGRLHQVHPEDVRMQVALDKTVHEFNMWNSMTRKPGAPWEYLLPKYRDLAEDKRLKAGVPKGEEPEISSTLLWREVFGMLAQKDYEYDQEFYGDFNGLSEKAAYFFHRCLQGSTGSPHALGALKMVRKLNLRQGLLADAQSFTLVELLRGLSSQGRLPPLRELFDSELLTLSYREGVCKPSASLYTTCLNRFARVGISAEEILHIGSRVRGDITAAKQAGMKTAIYAADKTGLEADPDDLLNDDIRPDRLLTDLAQLREILKTD